LSSPSTFLFLIVSQYIVDKWPEYAAHITIEIAERSSSSTAEQYFRVLYNHEPMAMFKHGPIPKTWSDSAALSSDEKQYIEQKWYPLSKLFRYFQDELSLSHEDYKVICSSHKY
jgi:hypothetical protein